jgi:3',5'-cyclic AMP phosphodiesterase CpdA
MSPGSSLEITILHVSDMQFGEHHRFGAGVESLASRLIQDLKNLSGEIPPIDVIVLSGDFSERGMQPELEQASDFVEQLSTFTGLDGNRVVVVPGNHDVNRRLCEGHFLDLEGKGVTPVPPYDPKWEAYTDFVQSLHGPDAFTAERPYNLHRIESLDLVVAALNSTMHESHRDEDHHGYCGEPQLQWFADELAQYPNSIRIAVVHHNPRAREGSLGAVDSEYLRDADLFTSILGPHLDLVLHGHTHDGTADYLSDRTLVLATGSAAVSQEWRPEEVNNQYQILTLTEGAIERCARIYKPDKKRWIGDNSLSRNGDTWRERIEVPGLGANVAPARPDRRRANRPHDGAPRPDLPAEGVRSDLLAEVAQVTRVDHGPDCHVEQRRSPEDPYLDYLLAFSGTDFQPVGVIDGAVERDTIEAFDRTIHARFQQRSPHVRSYLVHTGSPQPELRRWAADRGILLRTWTEYQNLLDLTAYTSELLRELEGDPLYPQRLYLDQRYSPVDRFGRTKPEVKLDLADAILDWLLTDEQGFGMVLGDAGFGKSFLIRRIAYRLLQGRSGLVPVVVKLRDWEKNHSVVEMVSQTVIDTGVNFQVERFQHMFSTGRLVLLVDGYDEFAIRVGYDRAADQLTTFLQAMGGGSKILLTSRPSHFRTREQATSVVFQDKLSHTRHQIYELQPFEAAEQREFLERWFAIAEHPSPDASATRWMDALAAVDNLPELARTPRMLSFMVSDLRVEDIEAAAQSGQTMTAAGLYERLIGKWLSTESDKVGGSDGADGSPQLSSEDRWRIAEELAFVLWSDQVPEVGQALLEEVADRALDLPRFGLTMSQAAQEIGSRTLLVGDGEQRRFAHQSVYEYLLARRLARVLRDTAEWSKLGHAELSELTACFLRDLAPEDAAGWIRSLGESHARRS